MARLVTMLARLGALLGDVRGSAAIETAIVAPVLVLMAIGSFEASRMVARQQELQTAASETEAIALAANAGATTNTTTLESILRTSLDLSDEDVTIIRQYRCDADTVLVSSPSTCGVDAVISSYIKLTITDSYEPIWTRLGIATAVDYSVVRLVQLS